MEYEIYFLCNLLGILLILIIIFFHFIEADEKIKTIGDDKTTDNSGNKASSSNVVS